MKVLAFHYYEGPNVHCLRPVAEAEVDLAEWAERRSDDLDNFVDALLAELPGLSTHHCSLGYPGGFRERLREGTYLGHVVEHVALELLFRSGEAVTYGKTRTTGGSRVRIVFEAETRATGCGALDEALFGVGALAARRPWGLAERFPRLRDAWAAHRLGPSTRAIVEAARRRGIPVTRLDGDSLVALGQGCRRVVVQGTLTGRTSAVGVDIAQDKALAKHLLAAAGLPVPSGIVTTSLEEALATLGHGAVVVKPAAGRHGDGVTMDVGDAAEMARAWKRAGGPGQPVLVEQQVEGQGVRLLVVGDRLVAAACRVPPQVVGDGVQTVAELVDGLNRDERRGPGHHFPLSRVTLDDRVDEVLGRQGLTRAAVPAAGRVVRLLAAANLSTGAEAWDVTDQVGADLARDAVRAAQAVGLDVAGVDVVTPDLRRGLRDGGGVVLEVNAMPGIRMHEHPSRGTPRRVGEAIVAHLFPDGATGRIPVAAVTGTNGKTTVARMLAALWAAHGRRVGLATTDGVWIGEDRVGRGDWTGPWSARLILGDPTVEAAVLETARGGIVRGGLGFSRSDVGVVTNIGSDHLGQDGIESLEDLVHVKALVVETVDPAGAAVLNADDPRVLAMRSRTQAEVVLFSLQAGNLAVRGHLAQGGRAVVLRRDALVWHDGAAAVDLLPVRDIPAAMGGAAVVNIANAAAAAAAALAAGVPAATVREALAVFPAGGEGVNQGRLEMVHGTDVDVVIDYAHNAPALLTLGRLVRTLRPRGPVVVVLGLPGDRRDADLRASGEAVAGFADRVVIREDADRRGRNTGEVAHLLEGVLTAQGMAPDAVATVLDEAEAVATAVTEAVPGSLVVVLYEDYARVREAVQQALGRRPSQGTAEARAVVQTGIG